MPPDRPADSGPDNPSRPPEGGQSPRSPSVPKGDDVDIIKKLSAEAAQKIFKPPSPTTPLSPDALRKREQLERVRNAKIAPITVEDLRRPGGIGDAYNKAWYDENVMALLALDNRAGFREATREGGMVFRFDEPQIDANGVSQPSVVEQMEMDLRLAETGDDSGGSYQGRMLVDDAQQVLAWLTWLRPPMDIDKRQPGTPYHGKISQLLSHGVTGGPMNYPNQGHFLNLKNDVHELLYFDTIQSCAKYGGHRLFAEAIREMADTPHVTDILLYRLEALRLAGRYIGHSSVGGNEASDLFFRARGCSLVAHDVNPDGPRSPRVINGSSTFVIPEWGWMSGDIDEVENSSARIWDEIQKDVANSR